MKTNKSLIMLMLALILLISACQPQAATSSDSSADSAQPADAAASPESTEAAASVDTSLFAALSELTGQVEIKQPGQASFAPASADMKLEVNGQVQTGEDGHARLDLSSGTIIRVAPSSLFTLTSNEEVDGGLSTQIQLELGKIFIILSGGSASVNTPAGVAAVQGSYLKIEFDPATGELTLTCLEGNCSVESPSGEKIKFTDGQKIVVKKDPTTGEWVVTQGDMTDEDFQEWLDNNPEAKDLVDFATNENSGSGGSGGSCSDFKIKNPPSGSTLQKQGKIPFEWTEQPGAAKYLVKFINAYGVVIVFETSDTSLEKYVEGILPDAGNVSWSVTAIGEDGAEICSTESSAFSKPDSAPDPKKDKTEGDEESTNNICANCYP